MTERVNMLREQSVNAEPSLTIERALIETEFYRKNEGKYSIPVLRAKNFYNLCAKKRIYIGDNELIVGERGPKTQAQSRAYVPRTELPLRGGLQGAPQPRDPALHHLRPRD